MWRYDANRSAAAPEGLPSELHLQWTRHLPPPRPAFPEDLRLCFDTSYQPVVMGGTMFVPSMVTDSVAALDVTTGARKWEFYADGPVRFAPVAWRGKVYFVSDDGYLYCLDAQAGTLLWRFCPAPADRRARKLLGNARMICRWPARTGPVLADGTVYSAAGIWPGEGIYVYALDAETGRPLWVNEQGGFIADGLIDHGTRRHGGLVPQGYAAVIGDQLIIPSGRALPAFFHRASGKMAPYTTGWGGRIALAKGSWRVTGIGDYFFNSGDLYALTPDAPALDVIDDAPGPLAPEEFAARAGVPIETVQRWMQKGTLVTVEQDDKLLINPNKRATTTYISWWTGAPKEGEQAALAAHPRLQIDPANNNEVGVFREPVLTTDAIYYSRPINNKRGRGGHRPPNLAYDQIVAYDLTKPSATLTCKGAWSGREVVWKTVAFDRLWSLPSDLKVHIKAGPRLYAGAPGVVAAIDVPEPGDEPRVSWRAQIAGTPAGMLADDGRLFVVTEEGDIYCFGGAAAQARTHSTPKPPAAANNDQWTRKAADLLERTGVAEGYCLAVGLGTGRLVEELARRSELHIVVAESDPERVEPARAKLNEMGLYGTRVHILPGHPASLRLPPYWAGLVVAESFHAVDAQSAKAVLDCLRPYGGVAHLPMSEADHAALRDWRQDAGLAGISAQRVDGVTLLTRAGPLPGSADWTHESAGPGNTFSSADQRVKPPFGLLWFGGPVDSIFPSWDYTHSRGPLPVIAGGRMFILVENVIHAVDIYTGRLLWEVRLDASDKTGSRRKAHMTIQRDTADNFIALPDCLYVAVPGTCLRLDAATGATLGEIGIPEDLVGAGPTDWTQMRVSADCFIGAVGKHLLCLNRHTGKELWRRACRQDRLSFAAGAGKVFCIDYWLPVHQRRGETRTEQSALLALDLHTGDVLWEKTVGAPEDTANEATKKRFPPLKPYLSYCEGSDALLLTQGRSTTAAHRGADGDVLWAKDIPCKTPPSNWSGAEPPVVLPDKLITHAGQMYDLRTGEALTGRLWTGMNTNYDAGGARGCGRALGNQHIATLRDGDASYYDLATGHQAFFRGIRSGCTNSLIPAGGLLNAPNFAHGCSCNWALFTSFATIHMPEAAPWAPRLTAPAAERGSAQ